MHKKQNPSPFLKRRLHNFKQELQAAQQIKPSAQPVSPTPSAPAESFASWEKRQKALEMLQKLGFKP